MEIDRNRLRIWPTVELPPDEVVTELDVIAFALRSFSLSVFFKCLIDVILPLVFKTERRRTVSTLDQSTNRAVFWETRSVQTNGSDGTQKFDIQIAIRNAFS